MKSLRIFFLSILLAACGSVKAQNTYWTCDEHSYEYSMTVYFSPLLYNEPISALDNYEVAAFSGDECRGIASWQTIKEAGKQYGYLRIRSNAASGEDITFKMYDKQADKTIESDSVVTFVSNGRVGFPSKNYIIDFGHRYLITALSSDSLKGTVQGGGYYDSGSQVTLQAIPSEGFLFVRWSDGVTDNPYSFIAQKDTVVYAEFALNGLTVTVSSACIATLYSDRNLIVPKDVNVYGLIYHSDGNYLNYSNWPPTPVSVTSANKGYIISAMEGSYVFRFTQDNPTADVSSDLSGVTTDTKASDITDVKGGTIYILADGNSGVGFYPVYGTRILKANAAYYLLPESQNPSTVAFIGFNTVDGLETAKEEGVDGNDAMFNAMGLRVDKDYKGLIISNGRKYINK